MWGEGDKEAGGTSECAQILWSNWMRREKTHWTERLDSPSFKQGPMAPMIWRG